MVKKKDGSNRVCVDYRKLNKITDVDPEAIIIAEDLFCRPSGMKYLSKINLTKGYWQISCTRGCVQNSVCDSRWTFGMVNSGAALVRGLKKVLEGLSGVGSYIDDRVIYSDSWEEHLSTLKELFGRLRRARGFVEVSVPLSDLLKKGKSEQVQWNEERAYSLLKEYLLQEPVLKLPDMMKLFVLRTDISGVGVAAVLLQEYEGKLYPVGYASKK